MEICTLFCGLLILLAGSRRDMTDSGSNVYLAGMHRTRVAGLPSEAGLSFPSFLEGMWTNVDEAGLGSYGAVWKATAKEGSCAKCQKGKQYAIKVFFAVKDKKPLTWDTASPDQQEELDAAQKECRIAAELSGFQDERAKFIADCVEEHVSRNVACGSPRAYCDSPLYVVLEPSGEELGRWWLKHGTSTGLDGLKMLLRQGLEAISFVADHHYIHHDIKSDNLLVREGPERQPLLQLIDWGAAMKTTSRCQPTVSNANAPPEWDWDCGYDTAAPAAYDLFCMGNVFMELIAGMPLVQMYNHSKVAPLPELETAATRYCRDAGFEVDDKDACKFWYSLQRFWDRIQNSRMTRASIKEIAEDWANARLPADASLEKKEKQKMIKAEFFDKLADSTENTFLDFLAEVFRGRAKDRPTTQRLLDHPWLQDASAPVSFHNPQLAENTSPLSMHDVSEESKVMPHLVLDPSSRLPAQVTDDICMFRMKPFSREAMCSRLSNSGDSCDNIKFSSLFAGDCKAFCTKVQSSCREEQVNPARQTVSETHAAVQEPIIKPERERVLKQSPRLASLNCLFNGAPFAKETMCDRLKNGQDKDCSKARFQRDRRFSNHDDCIEMCNLLKSSC